MAEWVHGRLLRGMCSAPRIFAVSGFNNSPFRSNQVPGVQSPPASGSDYPLHFCNGPEFLGTVEVWLVTRDGTSVDTRIGADLYLCR